MIRHFYIRLATLCMLVGLVRSTSVHGQDAFDRALNPEKALTQFVHEAWQTDDGLPQNSINAIAQTQDGYLWLGSQEGLVRFDGVEFREFNTRNENAFLKNDVRVLLRDRRGALWIGTRGGGLIRYKGGKFNRLAIEDSFAKDIWISSLVESAAGHIWVGTAEDGLFELRNGRMRAVDGINSREINALYEDESGKLWVGTRDAGLVAYYKGKAVKYSTEEGFPDVDVTAIIGSRLGGVWAGTRNSGVIHVDSDGIISLTTRHGLSANGIYSLYEDELGSLWVGTSKGGLSRVLFSSDNDEKPDLEFARVSIFDQTDGLTYPDVKVVFQDREGILWLGTDGGGLNLLREGKFTTYTKKEGLIDDFIYAVHEDERGAMWFSSEQGVSRLLAGRFSNYTQEHGLSRNLVISLASTPDGSVWMGTFGGGLSRYREGSFQTYTHQDGLPEDGVFALHTDSKGDLWIGTGGGVARFSRERFLAYSIEDGLSSNDVTVISEDEGGVIWIGTYNAGLNQLLDQTISPLQIEGKLSSNSILSLYNDSDGVLWIGTNDGGLNRVKDGRVSVITTKEGLFNDKVIHILEDDRGYLWMSCNKGLFRILKQELNDFADGKIDRVTSRVFDKTDGLKSPEFNGGYQPAGWKSRDGRLWFPSTMGVASIDPRHIPINETPPIIVLQDVIVDRERVPVKDEVVEFQPGKDKIVFHYAGISFVAPEKVRYKFHLEGVDEEWVEAGSRRAAYYTNLKPGHYTFRVMAQNGDGVWSENEATYSFYLKPFFYQTTWFFLVTAIVVLLGIVGVHRRRVAHLKANERELERLVEMRTRDLEKRTGDLLEALEENKEILGITSHDLKNPLGGIIGLADMLIEDLAELKDLPVVEEGLENLTLVKDEAERMLRIVKELLDKHRSGETVSIEKARVNLTELVHDAIRWNASKAEEKNIRLSFDSPGQVSVDVDADAMLRVADNLISNAVKYSPQGSSVNIDLKMENGSASFEVHDQGPGLTAEDLSKVFGRMQRLSAKPTGGEHSTGLGLYIVKQLVEEHGGEVGVTSEYGHGACFWFRVPLPVAPSIEEKKIKLVSLR